MNGVYALDAGRSAVWPRHTSIGDIFRGTLHRSSLGVRCLGNASRASVCSFHRHEANAREARRGRNGISARSRRVVGIAMYIAKQACIRIVHPRTSPYAPGTSMSQMHRKTLGMVAAILCTASCKPSPGGEGDICYPNGTCDADLVCLSNVCVRPEGPQSETQEPPELDACWDCGSEACSGEATACNQAGGCSDLLGCWLSCEPGDIECTNACDATGLTAQGSQRAAEYLTCLLSACAVDCIPESSNETVATTLTDGGDTEHPTDPTREVDIIFIVDDTSHMGEAQGRLASSITAFIEVLERSDVDADYRIGITSTNDGSVTCSSQTDSGIFRATSCLDLLTRFVHPSGESSPSGCTAACDDSNILTPWYGSTQSPPWVERRDGEWNLEDGISASEALACLLPLGMIGCAFESPLSSLDKALRRSTLVGDPNFGFLREGAALAMIIVTSADDCSIQRDNLDSETFFSSDISTLSLARCWHAGVECRTEDAVMRCAPVDKNLEGEVLTPDRADDEAILTPIAHFLDDISSLGKERVVLAGIVGVATDYDGGEIAYSSEPSTPNNPTFMESYGIGAGCTYQGTEAVPPARLKAFTDAFAWEDGPNLFSICNPDFRPALTAIAEQIARQLNKP